MRCIYCSGGKLRRKSRTILQRLRYAAIYTCTHCEAQSYYGYFGRTAMISVAAACPQCGNTRLDVASRRDKIDPLHRGLLPTLLRWLGAPLLRCLRCRLQFHDLRPRLRDRTADELPS